MKMSDKTYDVLNVIARMVLPLSEFVGALASIWGLPHGTQIVATLVALDGFLGCLLHSSAKAYNRGE